ncbi:hypothetical protein B7463_g8350, partial [Scytalidium lignicola]
MSTHEAVGLSNGNDALKNDAEKQPEQQAEPEEYVEPEKIQNPYFVNSTQPQEYRRQLPPWLDHFNAKDLKKLFKCTFAVWIQTILIFINPTLRVLGQAAFVGCIVLFIAPSAGILFMQLIATISILLGLVIGWAWGVIVMKTALVTRPAADLEARYALLQQMAQNTTNVGQASGQSEYLQIQIFEGFMLDTRVTVTYFCMMGLFIYLVKCAEQKKNKERWMQKYSEWQKRHTVNLIADNWQNNPDTIRSVEHFAAIQKVLSKPDSLQKSTSREEMLQAYNDTIRELKNHRDKFIDLTSQRLREPHDHLFNDNGHLRIEEDHFPPLSGLMWVLLFEERLLQLVDALDKLLSRIIDLESRRTKVRLWLPNRLMGLVRWIFRSEGPESSIPEAEKDSTEPVISRTDSTQINQEGKKDGKQDRKSVHAQLTSMRTPNSRQRSQPSQILLKITHWFASTEGIFALRVLVVTLVLTVPAVIRSSAGFYYREKGLWAVIMAQLSMVPYTGELFYGVIVRIVGTIIGGVVGMVAWYIGAGNGSGNPYGMAAIMAVVIVMFMWCRLFSPPTIMPAGIMMAATAYLVVAYGWVDTHVPSYGNPGVGYSVFWRRLVLVFVGFGTAVIVNFLPRPPSANRHYRRVLAESLAGVRDRYALFASNWADPPPDLHEIAEREALATGEILLSIVGPIKLTRLEFSTSNFDVDTLSQVCHLCMVLNHSITQLLLYTTRLPEQLKTRIIPSTGAVDTDLIVELMAVLSLVQQALKSGDPLPAVLPTPLFTRSIGSARHNVKQGIIETDTLFVRDNLGDERLRNYVAVLHAWVQFLGTVDELVLVQKRAVGETSDVVLPDKV